MLVQIVDNCVDFLNFHGSRFSALQLLSFLLLRYFLGLLFLANLLFIFAPPLQVAAFPLAKASKCSETV